jgi:hypothetical protein
MPYEEYQRKWIVADSNLPGCEPDDLVTFTVIVSCGGRPYVIGEYIPETNTIVGGAGEYEIRFEKGSPGSPSKIVFTQSGGGRIAGSWTANDTGPWPGDG